jgi:hypothetical protein
LIRRRLAFLAKIADFPRPANWDNEMKALLATVFVATAITAPPTPQNWCQVGQTVMIPDGREGPVTSLDGDLCQVLVYGESHATQWAYYLIEPVNPPKTSSRASGH